MRNDFKVLFRKEVWGMEKVSFFCIPAESQIIVIWCFFVFFETVLPKCYKLNEWILLFQNSSFHIFDPHVKKQCCAQDNIIFKFSCFFIFDTAPYKNAKIVRGEKHTHMFLKMFRSQERGRHLFAFAFVFFWTRVNFSNKII